MGLGAIGFGFLAGLLSVLSPCVLPVLPLAFAPAASAHKFGPAALAAGLVLSFVCIGLFISTIGFALGLGDEAVRAIAAVLLGVIGLVLLSGSLQSAFLVKASHFSNRANSLLDRFTPSGLSGQFIVGLILGAVWSPCVGPTLGAASLLAAQGRDLPTVAVVMAAFGVGAAVPLVSIGLLSRELLMRSRKRIMTLGGFGKAMLGTVSLVTAVFIVTGLDHHVETLLVQSSPAWLTSLTTQF